MQFAEWKELIEIMCAALGGGDESKSFFVQAEHDMIYYASVDKIPEDSQYAERLTELGLHVEDEYWVLYT